MTSAFEPIDLVELDLARPDRESLRRMRESGRREERLRSVAIRDWRPVTGSVDTTRQLCRVKEDTIQHSATEQDAGGDLSEGGAGGSRMAGATLGGRSCVIEAALDQPRDRAAEPRPRRPWNVTQRRSISSGRGACDHNLASSNESVQDTSCPLQLQRPTIHSSRIYCHAPGCPPRCTRTPRPRRPLHRKCSAVRGNIVYRPGTLLGHVTIERSRLSIQKTVTVRDSQSNRCRDP